MAESLTVHLGEHPIGELTRPQQGGRARRGGQGGRHLVDFHWHADAELARTRLTESFASSPALPLDRRRVSRFFGGYLPEGNQRQAMADQRQIGKDDLFAFLREYGGSVAGALSFRLPRQDSGYAPLSASDLRRALKDAAGKHNQAVRDDSRSMIPGFQPKVLVAKMNGQWAMPHGNAHSTHILKPPRASAPERIIDEFYAHELARALGLASFGSEIMRTGGMRYLAIERFDRRVVDGHARVIHQEDAAQAMGLDWLDDSAKFQDPRHPRDSGRASAYAIAEVLAALDADPLATWLRQLTFRVLIGDNDGHAKNVGIIHEPDHDRVSDLYDAVPNLFQADRIDWTLALAIDGEFDHRRITAQHFVREARSWGMRIHDAERAVSETLSQFLAALDTVNVPSGASPRMPESLRHTVEQLLAGREIGRFDRRRKG
jgi:serine/threonine-protein kinase HipA